MANEITVSGSLAYDDAEGAGFERAISSLQITVSSKKYVAQRMTVTTSEVAIPLGGVSTLGWAYFMNLDPTNFIELRTGTGGTKWCKLRAGHWAILPLGSGITAPYAIADTASCDMEYAIISV